MLRGYGYLYGAYNIYLFIKEKTTIFILFNLCLDTDGWYSLVSTIETGGA
jgi:hypothetical protein